MLGEQPSSRYVSMITITRSHHHDMITIAAVRLPSSLLSLLSLGQWNIGPGLAFGSVSAATDTSVDMVVSGRFYVQKFWNVMSICVRSASIAACSPEPLTLTTLSQRHKEAPTIGRTCKVSANRVTMPRRPQNGQGGRGKSLQPGPAVPPLKSDFYTREIKSLTRRGG